MANLGSIMFQVEADTAPLRKSVADVNMAARSMERSMESASASSGRMGKSFIGVAGAAVSMYAAISAIQIGFRKLAEEAVNFNKTLETSQIGIASILMTQGEWSDSQGNIASGQTKINLALKESDKITKQLYFDNLKTAATYEQLVKGYQQALAPGLSVGFTPDMVRQYSVAMIQAAGAVGVPYDMMAEEMRSMLRGTITPRTTLIATYLGITNEDIRKYQGNAQALFDFVMGRLKSFSDMGDVVQKSFEGTWSNLLDLVKMGVGQGGSQFFEFLKSEMQNIIDQMTILDDKGRTIIRPEVVDDFHRLFNIVQKVTSVLITIGETIVSVVNKITSVIDRLEHALDKALQVIDKAMPKTDWSGMDIRGELAPDPLGLSVMDTTPSRSVLPKTGEDLMAIYNRIADIQEILDTPIFRSGYGLFERMALAWELQTLQDMVRPIQEAAWGVEDFGNELNQSSQYANTLRASMDEVLDLAKELSGLNISAGFASSISKMVSALEIEVKALEAGKSAQRAHAEVLIGEKRTEVWGVQEALRQKGVTDEREWAKVIKGWSELDKSEFLLDKKLGFSEARKKGGKGPIDVGDMTGRLMEFEKKINDVYKHLTDASYDYWTKVAEFSGDYYTAESLKAEKWIFDQKEAFSQQVAEAEKSYKTMENQLAKSGKRGVDPEAEEALKRMEEKWRGLASAADEYNDLIEKSGWLAYQNAVKTKELESQQNIANYNVEYQKLVGSVQTQLEYEIKLLEIQKEKAMLGKTDAEAAAAEAYYNRMIYEKQITATGSWVEGFRLAAQKHAASLQTVAQQGSEAFSQMASAIDGWARSGADAIAEFCTGAKTSVTDMVNSITKDIIRMIAYQTIMKPMTDFLMGGIGQLFGLGSIGGGFGSIFGGGGGSITSSASGSLLSGAVSWLGDGFASGGWTSGRHPIVVGEKGPEVFYPGGKPGYIVPNSQLGRGSGGGGYGEQPEVPPNIRIDVKNMGQAMDLEQSGFMRKEGEDWVLAVVAKGMRTNRSFRSQMGGFIPRG